MAHPDVETGTRWWLNPRHWLTRVILLVLVPAVGGWISIFQLRGWGQIHESGVLGWIVVALGGIVLGGLVAGAHRQLGGAPASWTAIAVASFLAGVGLGSAAFDEFATFGGLELELATPADTFSLGEAVPVEIELRNTSEQMYANVALDGAITHACLGFASASSDSEVFDVGAMGAGEERRWTCRIPAGPELNGTFMFVEGDATDEQLVASSSDASPVDVDLIGFESTFLDPLAGGALGPNSDIVVLSGQPTTLTWAIENVGDHRGAVAFELAEASVSTGAGTSSIPGCDALRSEVDPAEAVTVNCTVVFHESLEVHLEAAADVPLDSPPVYVRAVAADNDPEESQKPLSIDRQVETYPGSGEWGEEGYYAPSNVFVRVTNGAAPAANVSVTDPLPDCTRDLGHLEPKEVLEYTCKAVVRTGFLDGVVEDAVVTATIRADGSTLDVTDSDASTVSSGSPPRPPSLPRTDGPDSPGLATSVVATIDRHFVEVMLIFALLGMVLLWLVRVIETAPAREELVGWHADPFERYELRWWDGTSWTRYVAADEPSAASEMPPRGRSTS